MELGDDDRFYVVGPTQFTSTLTPVMSATQTSIAVSSRLSTWSTGLVSRGGLGSILGEVGVDGNVLGVSSGGVSIGILGGSGFSISISRSFSGISGIWRLGAGNLGSTGSAHH